MLTFFWCLENELFKNLRIVTSEISRHCRRLATPANPSLLPSNPSRVPGCLVRWFCSFMRCTMADGKEKCFVVDKTECFRSSWNISVILLTSVCPFISFFSDTVVDLLMFLGNIVPAIDPVCVKQWKSNRITHIWQKSFWSTQWLHGVLVLWLPSKLQ